MMWCGAVPVAVLMAAVVCGPPRTTFPPTQQGIRTVVDTTFYDTEGVTRAQWLASMRAGARRAGVRPPFVAYTAWEARWSYPSSQMWPTGCEPRAPVIDLTIRYTMPRLVPDSGVALEDMVEWRRHATALWRHEEGHALRAFRAAVEMRDSITHVRAPSCTSLQPMVASAMDAVVRKYRALQMSYDARTEHGARQGAILVLPGITRVPADTAYRDTFP
jgi:predicted secreted Zn-dependent protease